MNKLLIDRDVEGAVEYVIWMSGRVIANEIINSYAKHIIADLLQNKVDMSQLVITKALAKTGWCIFVSRSRPA